MGIMVGSSEVFDCGLYPETPKSFSNYLKNNISNLANFGMGLSDTFKQMTTKLYQKHNDEAVLAAARNIAIASNMLFDMNIIQLLSTIEAIQNAKPLMQRFIMAMPELTVLHNEQRTESYFGTFTDLEPGMVGVERQDYRMITSGLVDEDPDGNMKWSWHFDVANDDDVQLTFRDRMDVLDTWDVVASAIAQGIDPTSLTGEKIQGI